MSAMKYEDLEIVFSGEVVPEGEIDLEGIDGQIKREENPDL